MRTLTISAIMAGVAMSGCTQPNDLQNKKEEYVDATPSDVEGDRFTIGKETATSPGPANS